MIEQLFVGKFFTVFHSAQVFNLDTPPLLNDLVGFRFELHHRRWVGWYIVCRPNLAVNNAVKR